MDSNDVTVTDEQANTRFVVTEGGADAQLVYRVEGDRLILTHTEVPEEFQGRGIGGRLVRAAAERAEADGMTVAPWCSYARKWLEDHPDVTERLTVDWSAPPSRES